MSCLLSFQVSVNIEIFSPCTQDARAAGCRTSAEAERYIEQKRKRETEENLLRLKENSQSGPSGKYLQRAGHFKVEHNSSPRGVATGPEMLDSCYKDLSSTTAPHGVGSALDVWDVSGFFGAELLSEAVRIFCFCCQIIHHAIDFI